jgi:hypothetical protein
MTFRTWLQQQWYSHCLEIEEWTGSLPTYPMQVYFQRYRWWLKREYRHQQGEK